MKVAAAVLALCAVSAHADIYMHNPRGSNNRNCRTDNNKERRNGNRLFDSQNNDNGGYSCPRAWPFDCYKFVDDGGAFNDCTNQNNNANKNMVNELGQLTNPDATNTQPMAFYSGSILALEWTAQHGLGTNSEVDSDVIIQYACGDTLTDNCDNAAAGASPFVADPTAKLCLPRDGTPVRVQDGNNNLNAEATNTIPDNANNQDDYRYGRHETYAFYQECKNRERNKGLWIADQNLNGNDARFTRQNPNGNRNGLECPEESEYYPYWHYTPWKDVAVVTNDLNKCAAFKAESGNVKAKNRCECNGAQACNGNGKQPNNERDCAQITGAKWVQDPAHGLAAPDCVIGQYSRQNHLGNTGAGPNNQQYNWTLPDVTTEQTCILRIRYNMSSTDFGNIARVGTSLNNGDNSPLKDNDENEALTYVQVNGMSTGSKLSFAINTDQYARTFQDRSYTFTLKPKAAAGRVLQEVAGCNKVFNLNVRGKRGNIVQAYPAVEYDFTPDHLVMEDKDCVHVQWTGSDYNPNRNGNNGEGGPYAANNRNKETKADRSNMVQMVNPGDNMPSFDSSKFNMFGASADYKKLAFLDQNIDGADCWDFNKLQQTYNNRAEREETYHNCMKLSGQETPYFNAGVQKPGAIGVYTYMSTRNNNFSNRGMKGYIEVKETGTKPTVLPDGNTVPPGEDPATYDPTQPASDGNSTAVAIAAAAVGVIAIGAFVYARGSRPGSASKADGQIAPAQSGGSFPQPRSAFNRVSTAFQGFAANAPWSRGNTGGSSMMTAVYDYNAQEPNELSFRRGETLNVLSKDSSGWGEAEHNGKRGVVPLNYLQ